MNKSQTMSRIREVGVLAVLRGPSPELTVKMVDALVQGGVYGIEVTFSTPNALEVVGEVGKKYGEGILIGMGTLTEPEQAAQAKQAGARFIVSPHCEVDLARAMVAAGLVVMIGALTPSEVIQACKLGADIVKIFPGSLVGPGYVKAIRGPFPDVAVVPTGGVSVDNVAEWFAAGVCAVGAGSELCPAAWAKEGRFADITERARAFMHQVEKDLSRS